jgi:hypothetical protein
MEQPDSEKAEWKSQQQTAALPGGSGTTQAVHDRLISTTYDSPLQSPQLDAADGREAQSDHRRWESFNKGDHGSFPRRAIGFVTFLVTLKDPRQNRAISAIRRIDFSVKSSERLWSNPSIASARFSSFAWRLVTPTPTAGPAWLVGNARHPYRAGIGTTRDTQAV